MCASLSPDVGGFAEPPKIEPKIYASASCMSPQSSSLCLRRLLSRTDGCSVVDYGYETTGLTVELSP
jgi:hypothetical protein